MLELLAWVEVNKKRLALGVLAVAVMVGVIVIWQWVRKESERAASSALLQLQLTERPDAPVSASALQNLAADHAGTAAAARARLLAAEALFNEGHAAEARAEFERARGLLQDDALVALAEFGGAACLEALGQTNEALTAYQEVTVRHPTSSVAGQAQLALAGLYERRGDPALALSSLRELSGRMDSAYAGTARAREESLLARHPELAPATTNSPSPAATPVEAGPSTNAVAP